MANFWLNGMMGLVVGEVLGMPVQFMSREEIKKHPIEKWKGMDCQDRMDKFAEVSEEDI